MTHATRPDLTAVRALIVTADPLLANHLTQLAPVLRSAQLTRIAGIGNLADVDGLLLLSSNGRHPAAPDAVPNPTGNGVHTTTVYIGTDLDDAGVWARAVALRAPRVLFSPSDDEQITALIAQHLQVSR